MLLIVAASAALWLLGLVRLDPHRGAKGTTRRVVSFFLLGTLSVVPAIVLSLLVPAAEPTYEPTPSNLALFTLVYAPIEEASKLLVFLVLATRARSLREPSDGIYQAAAVALGFAIVENLEYGLFEGAGVVLVRSFITPLRHMVYAAIWGTVYASRQFGRRRLRGRDLAAVAAAVAPSSLVHGLSNFLANVDGAVQLAFGAFITATALLVLRQLGRSSPFAARDLARPRQALSVIDAAFVHDPDSPHLHFRAAHFRLRAGETAAAIHHLERYLAARPGDAYGRAMKGAAMVLAGSVDEGERAISAAESGMAARTRGAFRRNLRRIITPGAGRLAGGYGESLLRTWLATSDLGRERIDPRRIPPR